jgi:hypothetical protein
MIQTVCYEVTGISSLLQNNPASMARGGEGLGMKKIPSPQDEAAAKVYRNENGQIFIPAISFRSSLLGACTGRRIGKVSAASKVSAGVFNAETQCPLYHPKTGKPITEYRLHSVRCVVQKNGVTRTRPEIPEWACKVALEIDTDFVSPDLVLELLSSAGRICGVGDWRPQKRGPHGRYTAKMM